MTTSQAATGSAWVAVVALLWGCAAAPAGVAGPQATKGSTAMVMLSDQDDGRTLSVHVGDSLELRLPENATTGYRWAPDGFDAKLVELTETAADYPKGAVGSGGKAVFRFKVVGAGSGAIRLKSWRSFEGDRSITKRFSVTLDATR